MRRDLESGDLNAAVRALPIALLRAPTHRETLRLAGAIHRRRGELKTAEQYVRDALDIAPGDAELTVELGSVLAERGQTDAAIECLRSVCATHPGAQAWLELGMAFDRVARVEEALAAANRAREFGSTDARTGLLRARCLQMLGDAHGAAAEYRELIRKGQEVAKAWFGLLDIKTIELGVDEIRSIRKFAADPRRSESEQLLLDFAVARTCEAAGELDEALEYFSRGSARARARVGWNAEEHSRFVRAVAAAFRDAQTVHGEPALGSEVLFIVGLPRSGSTLVEQILAAHPEVEGASELSDLPAVIAGESARRGKPYPEWVADAHAQDWLRLGREYLERTARWRRDRPRFTDKAPDNWKHVGAIAAMLPAARIIDCRRDALETCWSCYKQLFAPGVAGFAYAFDDLAQYWGDYLDLAALWSERRPRHYLVQRYEALVAQPATQIAELLTFCGLDADDRCLRPERAGRAVRTASSAQVREPMRNDTARAATYGQRLDRLAELLASADPATRNAHPA